MTVRTEPIRTLEDLLDATCDKYCGECSEPLVPPGSECPECGGLPAETRQEAAERLAGEPGAITLAEAARLREVAAGYLVAAEQVFREADAMEYRFELRGQRDQAQELLKEAADARERAVSALDGAVRAEQATAKPVADALRNHERAVKAEEKARRLRMGAETETEAAVRLSAAATVLARYQAKAVTGVRAREAAELAVMQAEQEVREREEARDRAQILLDRHAHVPLSRVTVASLVTPLVRMAGGQDINGRAIDQIERAMVGVWGRGIHAMAFAEFADALDRADEDRIRRQIEEEARQQPFLRPVGAGFLEARLAAPKTDGKPAAGAVVTPPPDLTPTSPFSRAAPGLPVRPLAGGK